MSVRRLAPADQQPKSFAFTAENLAWAEAQLKKFPDGRQASAVIPILWRAQEQEGWVSEKAVEWTAGFLGMAKIRVLEVATFYTMFQLHPVGKVAHVQVCGTTPCRLRGAGDIIEMCRHRIHHDPFHVSADGKFSWEEVECAGACVNAPMVQIFSDTYEDLTEATFGKLLDDLAAGRPVKPGVQSGKRVVSEQEGGATTLTDPSLYDGSVVGSWHEAFEARIRRAAEAKAEAAAKAAAGGGAAVATAPAAAPPAPKPVEAPKEAPKPAPAAATPAPAPAPAAPVTEEARAALAAAEEAEIKAKLATLADDATPEQKADAVGTRPAGLPAAREGKADKLQRVKGIGPVNEGKLHGLGIFHFDQISAWTRPEIRWVGTYLAFPGRIDREDWTSQAKVLAAGGKGLKD